jgi:hypothetical protein
VLIIFWTGLFGGAIPAAEWAANCPLVTTGRCALTTNQSRLPEADALVFHGPDFNANDVCNLQCIDLKKILF